MKRYVPETHLRTLPILDIRAENFDCWQPQGCSGKGNLSVDFYVQVRGCARITKEIKRFSRWLTRGRFFDVSVKIQQDVVQNFLHKGEGNKGFHVGDARVKTLHWASC